MKSAQVVKHRSPEQSVGEERKKLWISKLQINFAAHFGCREVTSTLTSGSIYPKQFGSQHIE